MREIKFRAWVKDNKDRMWSFKKRMLEVVNVDFYTREVYVSGLTNSDGVIWTSMPCLKYGFAEVELMQFTGLRDKNGKEVFEGDVVMSEWERKGKQRVYFVEWLDTMLIMRSVRDKDGGHPIFDLDNYEVIGNIYENPDLLEVRNERD